MAATRRPTTPGVTKPLAAMRAEMLSHKELLHALASSQAALCDAVAAAVEQNGKIAALLAECLQRLEPPMVVADTRLRDAALSTIVATQGDPVVAITRMLDGSASLTNVPRGTNQDAPRHVTAEESRILNEALIASVEIIDEGVAPADPLVADLRAELDGYDEDEDELPPPPDDDEVWERRASMWLGNRMWMTDWGPKPGEAGCMMPDEMLRGRRR